MPDIHEFSPVTSFNPAGMNLRRKPEKGFALQIHTRLGINTNHPLKTHNLCG